MAKNECRDFRQETIDHIKENLSDLDGSGDGFLDFWRNVFNFNRNLDSDMGNFDSYMRNICEINDITSEKLDEIIANVHAIENTYQEKFNGYYGDLSCCRSLLDTLHAEISKEDFETSFDKDIIYSAWENAKVADQLRQELEGLSDDELLAVDTSNYTDEELAVYMKVLFDRVNTDDTEYQEYLLGLIENTPGKHEIFVGILYSLYMLLPEGDDASAEENALADELAERIANAIATECSYSVGDKIYDYPFVVGDIMLKYSVSVTIKNTNPDAIASLKTTIKDQTKSLKFALGECGFLKANSKDEITLGYTKTLEDGKTVTVDVDVTKLLAGIISVTVSITPVSNDYFDFSMSLQAERVFRDNRLREAAAQPIPQPMSVINADAEYRTWWDEYWPIIFGVGAMIIGVVLLVFLAIWIIGLIGAAAAAGAAGTIIYVIQEVIQGAA